MFDTKHACDTRTHTQTERQTELPWHIPTLA